jgi:hypothetical protein
MAPGRIYDDRLPYSARCSAGADRFEFEASPTDDLHLVLLMKDIGGPAPAVGPRI